MAIGDVVRVTVWEEEILSKPAWAIITDDDPRSPDIEWVLDNPRGRVDIYGNADVLVDDGDAWEVAPPEDWPDEVCVAVAKFKMKE